MGSKIRPETGDIISRPLTSGMEASTGPRGQSILCWAGRNFDWASQISYYFHTNYGIGIRLYMDLGVVGAGTQKS